MNKIIKNITKSRNIFPLAVAVGLLVGIVVPVVVRADQYDDQMNALRQQNSQVQSSIDQLRASSSSLEDLVGKLRAQMNALQAQIRDSQAKSDGLQKEIVKAEEELVKQKKALGANLKAMYIEGDVSTLEMLASSQDLSEFFDKQQYRSVVQDKIKSTLDRINSLKAQLKQQKQLVDNLLNDQRKMESDVASQKAEQDRLLAMNQQEQNSLNSTLKNNEDQIVSLRAQQRIANCELSGGCNRAVPGDPGHGGYPAYLDNAKQDSLFDPWGMYNRECVSYAAWKVFQTYGYMPYWGGHGNANQWPASARADGISTGSTPRPRSVAISMKGGYGHAMWVEGVSGDTIYVSQYNYDLAGHYSEMSINGNGLTYIYFN